MTTLNLILPTCWQELTPAQLRYVLFLIAEEKYSFAEIETYCLFRWSGMEVIAKERDGYTVRFDNNPHHLTALQIAQVLSHLSWLEKSPLVPVRLPHIGKHTALPADFDGVPFETYLIAENLYTGYLHTQNLELLQQLSQLLYNADEHTFLKEECIGTFYWFTSLKNFWQRMFPNFFSGTADETTDEDLHKKLQNNINVQIRALTKGDVTKEKEILAIDCVRALTELDAQAKEYEELKKQTKS